MQVLTLNKLHKHIRKKQKYATCACLPVIKSLKMSGGIIYGKKPLQLCMNAVNDNRNNITSI